MATKVLTGTGTLILALAALLTMGVLQAGGVPSDSPTILPSVQIATISGSGGVLAGVALGK